jgi:tetratricopeptide (TPR) repeat protein
LPEDVPELLDPPVVAVPQSRRVVPLLQPEDIEPEFAESQVDPAEHVVTQHQDDDDSQAEVASIAETFAEPADPSPPSVDPEMLPLLVDDDRPASVVYEPPPESRLAANDVIRRQPVWIPSPNTVSLDPNPSEEGQTQELEEVIDTFREQMARALGDDGAARYDLGVAYYEMGLYNEALAEFEVAVKCPGLSTRTLEMMSSCLAQQGRHDEVVHLLAGPLSKQVEASAEERLSLQYAMGIALEAVGQQDDARRHFEEVALVDIGFRDVQSRLQR